MLWVVSSLLHRVRQRQDWLFSLLAGIATLISATLFALTQHVSWFTGIYWAVVTVTTVGYGDVVPKNTSGRILAIVTMLVIIPLVGAIFADWAAKATSIHIRRILGMRTTSGTSQHLVILGYTPLIPHLLPDLLETHSAIILVADIDPNQIPDQERMQFIAGDPTNPHVLAKANLEHARQIVIVGDSDGDVLMTAIEAQHVVPDGPILAITHAAKAVAALQSIGVEGIATQDLMGELITQSLATPHAAELLQSLLNSERTQLEEVTVPRQWVGMKLSAVRAQPDTLVLGVVQRGQFNLGLPEDPLLTDDTTVVRLVLRPSQGGAKASS
ncbi:MAG: ion channel [Firmicutes bacterium]|jgi:voltage-gated potassium channel|nr:ion channel [Bacillota bacterium]